jgi:ribulose-phosphate 3-epimerase
MVEVIPSILAKTPEEFETLVRKLEPHVTRVHLDIADGEFVDNKTINGWKELLKLDTKLEFDVHLMVKKPEDHLKHWYPTKADRFILHAESEGDLLALLTELEQNGKRRALALNPETSVDTIASLVPHLDFLQFMTVHPGFYGSPFLPEVIENIENFNGKFPHVKIAVDGGITPETAPKVCMAGASILVSGSYIIQSDDIAKAVESLKQ